MKASHKTIGAFALLVALGIAEVCLGQDKQQPPPQATQIRPSINKLMSHDEFTKAGLSKLNDEEIKALDAWLQKHTLSLPPGMTAFHVSMENRTSSDFGPARAITFIGLLSVRCFIWSNATGRPSYSPDDYYRCSGSHPLSAGEPVAWKCETKDGRTFTQITIDSTTYDLDKGRLFLLSRKAGALKVHQLQTGPTKPTGSGGQELNELEKSHAEIQDLFKQ